MYTLQACSVANGSVYDPSALAPSAAAAAATGAAAAKAQAAFAGLLVKNPADFASYGLNVAKDVLDSNAAIASTIAGNGAPAGSAPAAGRASTGAAMPSLLDWLKGIGKPGGNGGSGGAAGGNGSNGGASCDLSSGGVSVVPLNQPGSGGMPAVSAAPAQLTTTQGLPRGMGRYRPRSKARGMGECCGGFPTWGDAFPDGSPASASAVGNWIADHPWLAAAIAAAGVWLLSESGKKGRARG